MDTLRRLGMSHDELAGFCVRNRIRKLSLFGSILTDRFTPESDIDVVVEFEQDASPGLIGKGAIQAALSDLVGRRIDLRTPQELSRYFRQRVLDSAEIQYVRR